MRDLDTRRVVRDTRRVRLLALFVVAAGCSSSPRPESAARTAPAHDDPTCPVLVPGTSVTVEDTNDGAALVFVTTGDAAAVRKRAAALAEMHTSHHAAMGHDMHDMHGGDAHGGGQMGQMGMMISTHSNASVAEIPNGARVVFVAADAANVGGLQSELRMHAQHLANGTCEMAM
jgi:hypothetical protein